MVYTHLPTSTNWRFRESDRIVSGPTLAFQLVSRQFRAEYNNEVFRDAELQLWESDLPSSSSSSSSSSSPGFSSAFAATVPLAGGLRNVRWQYHVRDLQHFECKRPGDLTARMRDDVDAVVAALPRVRKVVVMIYGILHEWEDLLACDKFYARRFLADDGHAPGLGPLVNSRGVAVCVERRVEISSNLFSANKSVLERDVRE